MMWRCMLMLVLAPLAGCAGSEEATFDEDEVPAGSLRGVVVDPSIQPVGGAALLLSPGGLNATSDVEGVFLFEDLEPGTYTITASKEGYLEEVVIAAVASDASAEVVKIVLPINTEIARYYTTYHFQGFFECGVWPTNGCANINILTGIVLCQYGLCLGNVTGDRSIFLQWLDSRPDFVQNEMVWESTQPAGDALSVQLGGANKEELAEGMAPKYNTTQGVSPLTLTLGGQALQESSIGVERALLVRVSSSPGVVVPGGCLGIDPCGPGVQLLQDYELFVHTFNGYMPPPGWRFVEDGPPPGPP